MATPRGLGQDWGTAVAQALVVHPQTVSSYRMNRLRELFGASWMTRTAGSDCSWRYVPGLGLNRRAYRRAGVSQVVAGSSDRRPRWRGGVAGRSRRASAGRTGWPPVLRHPVGDERCREGCRGAGDARDHPGAGVRAALGNVGHRCRHGGDEHHQQVGPARVGQRGTDEQHQGPGTMMIPPPTPSRAAMTPAISPMITKRTHGSSALLIGGTEPRREHPAGRRSRGAALRKRAAEPGWGCGEQPRAEQAPTMLPTR